MGWFRELWATIKDTLNVTKADPTHVGLGAAFGVFLGCVPANCGLVALVWFLVGLTDTSIAATFLVGLAIRGISIMVLDPTSWTYGRSICESSFADAHASWWGLPGIALLGLERYHVMGGAVFGAALAIPSFFVVRTAWKLWHHGKRKAAEKIAALRKKRDAGDAAAGAELAQLEAQEGQAGETASAAAAPAAAGTAAGTAAAGAAPDAKPAKKKGPIGRVIKALPKRTWVMVLLLVALDLFGLKPAVRWGLQKKFPESLAKALGVVNPDGTVKQMGKVTWSEDDYEVSLLKGRVQMTDLHIANPKNPAEDLFAAKTVTVTIDRLALLRRRIVLELVKLDQPALSVARGQDGTLSIEPQPTTPPPPAKPGTDWAQKAHDAYDRAKKEYDERKKKKDEEKKEAKKPEPTEEQKDKLRRPRTLEEAEVRAASGIPGSNDLLASPPRWTVHRVETNGLDVKLSDPQATSPAPLLSFKDGNLLELIQDRKYLEKASECHLEGDLLDAQTRKAEGQLKVDFTLDPDAADKDAQTPWKISVHLTGLDLHATDALYANGVPLSFAKGTATISFDAQGSGLDSTLSAAPKIAFKDVEAHPRDPSKPIAGMDATKVAQEVTNAGSFELNDITVSGTMLEPKISLGNTLRDLVVQGGINYGKKAATGALEKGLDALGKKVGDKVPGAGEKIDDAKKNAGGLIDKGLGSFGIGGGDKKDEGK